MEHCCNNFLDVKWQSSLQGRDCNHSFRWQCGWSIRDISIMRVDWFDWAYMVTHISDIGPGKKERDGSKRKKGGGELGTWRRGREASRSERAWEVLRHGWRDKNSPVWPHCSFHFLCPNIQFIDTQTHTFTHPPLMSVTTLPQITLPLPHTQIHTHTHLYLLGKTSLFSLSFTPPCSHFFLVLFPPPSCIFPTDGRYLEPCTRSTFILKHIG